MALLVPDGTYDFTGLNEAHRSVPPADVCQQPLRARLFVRRNDVTRRAARVDAAPVLTDIGPGADGVHHGRVSLLLVSCAENPPPCSSYAPTITVDGGAPLGIGAPVDCADCSPSDAGYIPELR